MHGVDMPEITRAERVWNRIEDAVIGLFAGAALLLICVEVLLRYFSDFMYDTFGMRLPDWNSEVTIYLTVWAMLIAGSQLVLTGRHIRADLVVRQLPRPVQYVLELLNLLVGLGYCALVAWFGWKVVEFGQMLDERSESSLQFQLWIFYLILPIAFGLMAVRYLINLYRFLFRFRPEMLFDDHDNEAGSRIERSQS